MEEKLCWTFSLYDINGDGRITREEMTDIVTAIYELMGRIPETQAADDEKIKEKVDRIFQVIIMLRLINNYACTIACFVQLSNNV
jgi:Kv channel-interacting protein